MGTSKQYREGPSWAEKNTPGPKRETYSKGSKSTAEGTHQSGMNDFGRTGMKNSARDKSKASKAGPKTADKGGY